MTDNNNALSKNFLWVVIVNWNQPLLTEDCIKSLLNQQKKFNFTILLIDNGSSDYSSDYLKTKFPEINFIGLPTNMGFAGGYNYGLRTAYNSGAEYILIVNNDTVADDDLIVNLMKGSKEVKAHISAPIIYYMGTKDKIWSAGGKINPILNAPIFPHSRHKKFSNKPIKQEFISGCGMLISRKTIETIGYFDENYFLYYEDLDYCFRVKQAGLAAYLIPTAKLWHHISASSKGSDSPEERYWMGYSSQRYFHKHISGLRWIIVAPWRLLHLIKTWIKLLSMGKFNAAKAFVKGTFDGLTDR